MGATMRRTFIELEPDLRFYELLDLELGLMKVRSQHILQRV